MNRIYLIILFVGTLVRTGSVHAQQQVSVSQYMFNGLFLNPGSAGSHAYATSSLLHRSQWAQMEGAPTTSMVAFDAPLMKQKIGAGFTVVHDRIGISKDLDLSGNFAYHMRIGTRSKLAFGLRAGVSIYSAQLSGLRYWDTNDQVLDRNLTNVPVAKFGFGLYWYRSDAYLGLSAPSLFAADKAIKAVTDSTQTRYYSSHYYLHAGKVYPLSESLDIKPNVLVKFAPNAAVQADLNCNLLYRERLWLGVGYRTGAAFVGMVEYVISPQLRIGYAYDMAAARMRNYTTGSHEIMIGFDLGREAITLKSPRYF
ncbi:MAG: type IX secretion system membrane protein PorP/SprF [Flavobacteriales bacterium]|nr:type IX secretion system membrane protein PorP/SprF [Flavobacteriales bacterium]MBK6946495.1 type IX secretion system membrane protein PorP/SprF [Flavobacteriales bacterium]